MEAWSDFNVAMAGAAAALAGLIIVAISVNIEKILKEPSLTARAAASIGVLVVTVLACGLGLIPAQPTWALGVELIAPVLVALVLEVNAVRRILVLRGSPPGGRVAQILAGFVPVAAFVVGTVVLLLGVEAGWIGVAVGALTAVATSVLYAWVALVEVLR